ncbi:MAG TPA: DUF5659 domain-containing protein [Blastocatellia bacterium]
MNRSEYTARPYATTDLNRASVLRCRNFTITEITRLNGKTIFAFEDSAQLRGAILDYANDGQVGVRSFCSTMRDLKAITK